MHVVVDDTRRLMSSLVILFLQEFCDKYMCDKDIFDDMPSLWWITSPKPGKGKKKEDKPILFLLAALVHRNNPDCIPDAVDAPAGAPREDIRTKTKDNRSLEVAAAKVAPQTNRGKLEESMMKSKAALMEQTKEQQYIQGVQNQLMMMEKFKSSFVNMHNRTGDGDAEYDETICDLLAELPIMKKRKATKLSKVGRGDSSSVTSDIGSN